MLWFGIVEKLFFFVNGNWCFLVVFIIVLFRGCFDFCFVEVVNVSNLVFESVELVIKIFVIIGLFFVIVFVLLNMIVWILWVVFKVFLFLIKMLFLVFLFVFIIIVVGVVKLSV